VKIPVQYKPEVCASKDTTRKILNSVEICEVDPITGEVMLVATDGHSLVAVPVRAEEDNVLALNGPVSPEALIRARKLAKTGKLCDADLKVSATHYTFADGSTMPREDRKPEESFPAWRETFTEPKPGPDTFRVAFNLSLLTQVAEALGDKKGIVTLTITREAADAQYHPGEVISPILVKASGGDSREVGVLMPARP
jgi:hypothetical protein